MSTETDNDAGSLFSLASFAEAHLADPGEWEEFVRVKDATPPREKRGFENGKLISWFTPENPEYLRRIELHRKLLNRFFEKLDLGEWEVYAFVQGTLARQEISPEHLRGRDFNFADNKIGRFWDVQIKLCNSINRLARLTQFIKQVCDIIPPKAGVKKSHIQSLADSLLPIKVTDELFKVAWGDAKIDDRWRQPGP